MKFTYFDFYILEALHASKSKELCDICLAACKYLPAIPSAAVLSSSISKLVYSGFARYENGELIPSQRVKDFFSVKKLFENKKKCRERLLLSLCNTDTEISDTKISDSVYSDVCAKIRQTYDIRPCIYLEGSTLFFCGEDCEVDDDCINVNSFFLEISDIEMLGKNMLSVCDELTSPTKSRKLTLDSCDASYILSISQSGASVVLKAQKILFNRKRFSGKLNSSLDYAQCGDSALHTSCDLYDFLHCVALICLECESTFGTEDYQRLMNIAL